MNANLNVIGSGLCEVSASELTAVDGGHPVVRVAYVILGYAAEKLADALLSGPGLLEINQQLASMD